eukprot:GFUD01032996.1.p1 GENE.GFUD01032996.1~~GFUD01032996.1.p1  ORF type:complete len:204 (-),score=44.04 GFUD01032996.1:34-645(-)
MISILVLVLSQAMFLAAHQNDGCHIEDQTEYWGAMAVSDYLVNISTVFQCASLCRVVAGCSYWTLYKSGAMGGQCALWDNIEGNGPDRFAISGSVACGEDYDTNYPTTLPKTTTATTTSATTTTTNTTTTTTTTTTKDVSDLCRKLFNVTKLCGLDPKILHQLAANGSSFGLENMFTEDGEVDDEHCESLGRHLRKFCGVNFI